MGEPKVPGDTGAAPSTPVAPSQLTGAAPGGNRAAIVAAIVSVLAVLVSGAGIYFTREASLETLRLSRDSFTYTVKSQFLANFPNDSKRCLAYFHEIDNSVATDAIQGKSHRLTSDGQRANLTGCLHETVSVEVGGILGERLAAKVKNKAKLALDVLEHAASQLENADPCSLAQELFGVMSWPETAGAVENFKRYGVGYNPSLFGAILDYRRRFVETKTGLSSVCH